MGPISVYDRDAVQGELDRLLPANADDKAWMSLVKSWLSTTPAWDAIEKRLGFSTGLPGLARRWGRKHALLDLLGKAARQLLDTRVDLPDLSPRFMERLADEQTNEDVRRLRYGALLEELDYFLARFTDRNPKLGRWVQVRREHLGTYRANYSSPTAVVNAIARVQRTAADVHGDARALLAAATVALRDGRGQEAHDLLQFCMRKALQLVCTRVEMYLRKDSLEDLRVSANYMHRFDKSDGNLLERTREKCTDQSSRAWSLWRRPTGGHLLDTCTGTLLAVASNDPQHYAFWIPLFESQRDTIWGAPQACGSKTASVVYCRDLPPWPKALEDVHDQVAEYLRDELKYEMFLSLPVLDRDETYASGVVNVNLSREYLSLYSPQRREQLLLALRDVLWTLGSAGCMLETLLFHQSASHPRGLGGFWGLREHLALPAPQDLEGGRSD